MSIVWLLSVHHQRKLANSKRATAPGLGFRDNIQVMWGGMSMEMGDENRDWHE